MLKSFNPQTISPALLEKLKSTAVGLLFYNKYIDAVTHSVQVVFLVAVPICFVAFLLSFLLPEVELRKTVETVDLGEVQGAPQHRSSLQEIELALTRMSARENRAELYHDAGAAGRGSTCRPGRSGCCTACPNSLRAASPRWPNASRWTRRSFSPGWTA